MLIQYPIANGKYFEFQQWMIELENENIVLELFHANDSPVNHFSYDATELNSQTMKDS